MTLSSSTRPFNKEERNHCGGRPSQTQTQTQRLLGGRGSRLAHLHWHNGDARAGFPAAQHLSGFSVCLGGRRL